MKTSVTSITIMLPLLLASCELLDLEPPLPRDCATSGATPDLTGRWVIKGVGERKGCEEGRWNSPFELGPSRSIAITSMPGADSKQNLSLTTPMEGFSLTGSTEGTCVDFVTSETFDGETVRYRFEGGSDSQPSVFGKFSSSDPVGCTVEGTFEVIVSR